MSLIGEFLHYRSYEHDILPCIVRSITVPGKALIFEQYIHKFSIFRKACLPGFGIIEYSERYEMSTNTFSPLLTK